MTLPNCSQYLWKDSKGKIKIKGDQAFISLYPHILKSTSISEISEQILRLVLKESKNYFGSEPSLGSCNNCKGSWNEMAFLYSAHSSIINNTDDLYIVKMGNESSLKFWEIYNKESRSKFEEVLLKLKKNGIFIRCSNPDFIVLKRSFLNDIPNINSPSFYRDIKNYYKTIINQCNPCHVIGFISLKTSNRPDRRYQILYEANITKYVSQYIHHHNSLRFDSIGKSNDSDAEVFKAPLLHTLPKLNIDKFEEQFELIEGPIIDSDTTIHSTTALDHYWTRYVSTD